MITRGRRALIMSITAARILELHKSHRSRMSIAGAVLLPKEAKSGDKRGGEKISMKSALPNCSAILTKFWTSARV